MLKWIVVQNYSTNRRFKIIFQKIESYNHKDENVVNEKCEFSRVDSI